MSGPPQPSSTLAPPSNPSLSLSHSPLPPPHTRRLHEPDDLCYEGLGEVEAGVASQDPIDPHTFPVATKDQPTGPAVVVAVAADRLSPPLSPSPHTRSVPSALEREAETQLQTGLVIPVVPSDASKDTVASAEKQQVHMGHEMIAGSASAFISRLCIAPLDVLKIRFQIQEQARNQRQYTSVMQAFTTIYRKEGILAFWKGNAAAELMVVPYGAVSFLAYSSCKSWFPTGDHANHQHLSSLIAGSFAGFCATISTYPLDLLRTRFAAQQEHKVYRSLLHAGQHIVSREGLSGLYVGIAPTLIGIVPLMALQFGAYEALKQAIKNAKCPSGGEAGTMQLSFLEQSLAGFSAGVLSKYFTMPLDVIKKRFQVSGFEMNQADAARTQPTTSAAPFNRNVTPTASAPPSAASTTAPPTHSPTTAISSRSPHPNNSVLTHSQPLNAAASTTSTNSPLSSAVNQSCSRLTSTHLNSAAPTPAQAAMPTPSGVSASNPQTSSSVMSSLLQRRFRPHSQPVPGRRPFTGVWDCARGIYAHEGVSGLFKGSVPSVLKAGPNSAIIYMVYEYTIRWLNQTDREDANGDNGNHKFKA